MLPRRDGQRVQGGLQPQAPWLKPSSGSPGFAQLFGEHEEHLIAVFMPESRRIAVKQRPVNSFGAHHAPDTSPTRHALAADQADKLIRFKSSTRNCQRLCTIRHGRQPMRHAFLSGPQADSHEPSPHHAGLRCLAPAWGRQHGQDAARERPRSRRAKGRETSRLAPWHGNCWTPSVRKD